MVENYIAHMNEWETAGKSAIKLNESMNDINTWASLESSVGYNGAKSTP